MVVAQGQLDACPHLSSAFQILGMRWNAVIIDLLVSQPARFTEIHRAVPGLSDKVLTERLAGLVDAGLVRKTTDPGAPRYELTEAGVQLAPALDQIRQWAEGTLADDDAPAA